MTFTFESDTRSREPGNQLLIMDLAHILVKKQGKGKVSVRPHVVPFLRPILEDEYDYILAIWSSMPPENVQNALNNVLNKEEQTKLLFVWTQDQCNPLVDEDNQHTYKYTRDLQQVWNEYPQFNQKNTIIFIDEKYKVMDAYQECCLILPQYDGPRLAKNDIVFVDMKTRLDNHLF